MNRTLPCDGKNAGLNPAEDTMNTKGERREAKRKSARKMKVSGRSLAQTYKNAILKKMAGSSTGKDA